MSNIMTLPGYINVHISTNELNQINKGHRSLLSEIWDKIVDWFCGTQKVKAKKLLEKFCSGQTHDAVRIESFKELKKLASEAYKRNFRKESLKESDAYVYNKFSASKVDERDYCEELPAENDAYAHYIESDSYALYDDDNNCLVELKQYKVNKNSSGFEKIKGEMEREIKEEIDKIEFSEENRKVFFSDYERGRGQYYLNEEFLILEDAKDIESKIQKEGVRVIYGICYQVLPPILFINKFCYPVTGWQKNGYKFIVDNNKKLQEIHFTYSSDMASRQYLSDNKEDIFVYTPKAPPPAKSIEFHACLKVEYDDAGRSSVKIDSFDCKYTKASEALI